MLLGCGRMELVEASGKRRDLRAEVLTTSFEDWQPRGAPFDAVVAFNSLHWIDPQLRYSKPFSLLEPDAVLVMAGCKWA